MHVDHADALSHHLHSAASAGVAPAVEQLGTLLIEGAPQFGLSAQPQQAVSLLETAVCHNQSVLASLAVLRAAESYSRDSIDVSSFLSNDLNAAALEVLRNKRQQIAEGTADRDDEILFQIDHFLSSNAHPNDAEM